MPQPSFDPRWRDQVQELFKGLRVVAVDDNEDIIAMIGPLLESLGCDARVCSDSSSCLQLIHEFAPEVVFLDIAMPGRNGVDIARDLRRHDATRNIAIVAASGFSHELAVKEFDLSLFDHYVVKPLSVQKIADLLIDCTDRRLQRLQSNGAAYQSAKSSTPGS